MSEKINWNYAINVISGPQVSQTGVIDVDAYDKFTVTIDKSASQTVELIPGAAGNKVEKVKLLVLSPSGSSLSYTANGQEVPLDGPHVFIGTGAVQLLGQFTGLTFKNDDAQNAAVLQIIIGRDATSAPGSSAT